MSRYHLYFLATSLYRGREFEIISRPRASIEGESSEFFQVPKPIWGGGGCSSKASGKMKKYRENTTKYEGRMKKCEGNIKKYDMKEYMENMKEI